LEKPRLPFECNKLPTLVEEKEGLGESAKASVGESASVGVKGMFGHQVLVLS